MADAKDAKSTAISKEAIDSLFAKPVATPAAVPSTVKDSKERSDNRTAPNQLRAMSAECSLLSRADGSVRYSQGKTSLLVAVYGPLQVRCLSKFDRKLEF